MPEITELFTDAARDPRTTADPDDIWRRGRRRRVVRTGTGAMAGIVVLAVLAATFLVDRGISFEPSPFAEDGAEGAADDAVEGQGTVGMAAERTVIDLGAELGGDFGAGGCCLAWLDTESLLAIDPVAGRAVAVDLDGVLLHDVIDPRYQGVLDVVVVGDGVLVTTDGTTIASGTIDGPADTMEVDPLPATEGDDIGVTQLIADADGVWYTLPDSWGRFADSDGVLLDPSEAEPGQARLGDGTTPAMLVMDDRPGIHAAGMHADQGGQPVWANRVLADLDAYHPDLDGDAIGSFGAEARIILGDGFANVVTLGDGADRHPLVSVLVHADPDGARVLSELPNHDMGADAAYAISPALDVARIHNGVVTVMATASAVAEEGRRRIEEERARVEALRAAAEAEEEARREAEARRAAEEARQAAEEAARRAAEEARERSDAEGDEPVSAAYALLGDMVVAVPHGIDLVGSDLHGIATVPGARTVRIGPDGRVWVVRAEADEWVVEPLGDDTDAAAMAGVRVSRGEPPPGSRDTPASFQGIAVLDDGIVVGRESGAGSWFLDLHRRDGGTDTVAVPGDGIAHLEAIDGTTVGLSTSGAPGQHLRWDVTTDAVADWRAADSEASDGDAPFSELAGWVLHRGVTGAVGIGTRAGGPLSAVWVHPEAGEQMVVDLAAAGVERIDGAVGHGETVLATACGQEINAPCDGGTHVLVRIDLAHGGVMEEGRLPRLDALASAAPPDA